MSNPKQPAKMCSGQSVTQESEDQSVNEFFMGKSFRASSLALLILIVTGLAGCSVATRQVSSASMLPLIAPGDKFFLDTSERARTTLHDGDVIAFNHGQYQVLKRIVAMPGETIKGQDSKIFRNGELVSEPYLQPVSATAIPLAPSFPSRTIPPGELFVLGDNRDFSLDSRQPEFGVVHASDVIGTYKCTYWHATRKSK